MAWNPKATERLADVLRFIIAVALLVDGIILALASMYFVLRFCWFALRWLDRVAFSKPW